MTIQDSQVVILTNIRLNHPTLANHGMEMNFVFDRQPQVQDIMGAYNSDPFLTKHEHYATYGPMLAKCLKTFGVPQLFQLNLTDADGFILAVPFLHSTWTCNLAGRTESVASADLGDIRLFVKPVRTVKVGESRVDTALEDDLEDDKPVIKHPKKARAKPKANVGKRSPNK